MTDEEKLEFKALEKSAREFFGLLGLKGRGDASLSANNVGLSLADLGLGAAGNHNCNSKQPTPGRRGTPIYPLPRIDRRH